MVARWMAEGLVGGDPSLSSRDSIVGGFAGNAPTIKRSGQ